MRYTLELELPLDVEVVDALHGPTPTRTDPGAPDWVELCVRLGTLDVTEYLPPDVLQNLEDDALERLRRAAAEP